MMDVYWGGSVIVDIKGEGPEGEDEHDEVVIVCAGALYIGGGMEGGFEESGLESVVL
jgi:hypothetical protein